MDLLAYLCIGTATAFWRLIWLGFVIPVWRVFWKGVALVTAAWAVNRLEQEYETGAYRE